MRGLIPFCAASMLLAGCYDSHFGEPGNDGSGALPTITLVELRRLYTGDTFPIKTEVTITGIVTTSDRDENFYRTLCIQQQGAGIEIMAGIDHLHNDYPVGCRVTLQLKGLSIGESYGVLQAGRNPAPGSGFTTDYIGGTKAALNAYLTRCGDAPAPYAPTVQSIGELTPEMCGTLVRIDGIRYTPEDLTPGTWAGYKRFTDSHEREIFTYTRLYASFAENDVPVGSVSLTGILQFDAKGDGRFLLKLRDAGDCASD